MPAAAPFLLRFGAPSGVVLVVLAADIAAGPGRIVVGLLCAVPLLVSQLDGPRQVLGWGALCLTLQSTLGVWDGAYDDSSAVGAQAFRLAFTASTTLLGAGLAWRRLRQEEHLRRLTDVATTAQRAILRPLPAVLGSWRLAVDYASALRESHVGGDFYDALLTPDGRLLLLIGDTRGKGLPAVRLATSVLGTFRHPSSRTADPADICRQLHESVRMHGGDEDFVTAALLELHPDGRCSVHNAGHPPPLLVRAGAVSPLAGDLTAPPLGLGATAAVFQTQLQAGDRLLLYTDGLTEARRPQDRAFFPLHNAVAATVGRAPLPDAVAALRDATTTWTGHALADDMAVLAVEVQPAADDHDLLDLAAGTAG